MSTKVFEAFLREFVAKAGSSILLPTFNQGGQQYLYSDLAPVASSARDLKMLLANSGGSDLPKRNLVGALAFGRLIYWLIPDVYFRMREPCLRVTVGEREAFGIENLG